MTNLRLSTLLGCTLATGLTACADLGRKHAELNISSVTSPVEASSPSDGLYRSAVAAMRRRDYVEALDLLQAARERSSNDPRVLNAFGVIYDKLGRFDLSQRYYAQAQAADPASTIVAQNLAYSKTLQRDSIAFALAEAPELKTASQAATIERKSTRLAMADQQLRPVMALATAAPVLAAAATPSRRPEPVRIVAPVAVASAFEPFVVRLTNRNHVASVAPIARPQLVAAAAAPPQPRLPLASAVPDSRSLAHEDHAVRTQIATLPPVMAKVGLQQAPVTAPLRVTSSLPSAPTSAVERRPTNSGAKIVRVSQIAVTAPLRTYPALPAAPAKAGERTAAPPAGKIVRISTPAGTKVSATRPASPSSKPPIASPRTPIPPQRQVAKAQPPHAAGLLGRPVMVVYNGSGRRSADQLRAHLAHRGWTLALANGRAVAPSVTTIRYAANSQRVALALARSLRIPVKLEACRVHCSGITILVGGQGVMRTAATNGQPRKTS